MDQFTGAIVTLGLAFIGVAALYQLSTKGGNSLASTGSKSVTTLGGDLFQKGN
jgi:hypothetical protein